MRDPELAAVERDRGVVVATWISLEDYRTLIAPELRKLYLLEIAFYQRTGDRDARLWWTGEEPDELRHRI
jgi:hypothetical protein